MNIQWNLLQVTTLWTSFRSPDLFCFAMVKVNPKWKFFRSQGVDLIQIPLSFNIVMFLSAQSTMQFRHIHSWHTHTHEKRTRFREENMKITLLTWKKNAKYIEKLVHIFAKNTASLCIQYIKHRKAILYYCIFRQEKAAYRRKLKALVFFYHNRFIVFNHLFFLKALEWLFVCILRPIN